MQRARTFRLHRIWRRLIWGRRTPLALAFVFALTQLTTLTHNAEYGADHHHNHQICDFVVHGDRLDCGNPTSAAVLFVPFLLEHTDSTAQHQIDARDVVAYADPRAPPSYA